MNGSTVVQTGFEVRKNRRKLLFLRTAAWEKVNGGTLHTRFAKPKLLSPKRSYFGF